MISDEDMLDIVRKYSDSRPEVDEKTCVGFLRWYLNQSKWLDIKTNPPTIGEDYAFIVVSIISTANGRVLGGRYKGNGSFSVVGTTFRATKYQALPKP